MTPFETIMEIDNMILNAIVYPNDYLFDADKNSKDRESITVGEL